MLVRRVRRVRRVKKKALSEAKSRLIVGLRIDRSYPLLL